MSSVKMYRCTGDSKYHTGDFATDDTTLCPDEAQAEAQLAENLEKIAKLQEKLYAEKREGLAIVIQAMDAAGKDGTIRAVLSCLSPHGTREVALKSPSKEELAHDYLWRVAKQMPVKGDIVIFNRSHYEDVLIGRVRELYKTQPHAPCLDGEEDRFLQWRYEDIRNFETYLSHNSVRVVKLFLNVSRAEQRRRFLSRIAEPKKNWKFSSADIAEAQLWDDYQDAYEAVINKTATPDAPWYVVPADNKWYMRYVVSEIIAATLKDMNPHFPDLPDEEKELMEKYRQMLENQQEMEQGENE